MTLFNKLKTIALIGICPWALTCQGDEGPLVLVTPVNDRESVLLDAETGKEVHVWKNKYLNGGASRLLPDGGLLRVIEMAKEKTFQKCGFQGGGLEIVERDGSLRCRLWLAGTFEMNTVDALMLPNGNLLAIMLEWKTKEEAVAAGRAPQTVDEKGFLVPALVELKLTSSSTAAHVWRWSLWNHTCQSRDKGIKNYSVERKAGCVDITMGTKVMGRKWLTPLALSYNADEKLIALTMAGFQEPWIIDHSVSSDEAAGDQGGDRQHGGRILNENAFKFDRWDTEGDALYISSGLWAEGQPGNEPVLYTVARSKGRRQLASHVFLPESRVLGREVVIYEWHNRPASQDVAGLKITPSLIVPADPGRLVMAEMLNGRVELVEANSSKVIWKYMNRLGSMKIKLNGESACCGMEEVGTASTENRRIFPIRSAQYYPAGYIQASLKK